MNNKKCGCCNIGFKPKRKTQKYCSKTCGQCNKRQEKIKVICEYTGCTNTFHKLLKSQKRFCSRDCQVEWQKYHMIGENNPNYGNKKPGMFKHTDNAKEKIRNKVLESWQTDSRREKHKEFFKRHRLDNGSMDWHTISFRKRISDKNIERLLNCDESFAYKSCKKGYVLNKTTNKDEFYHSSWEEIRMIELNDDNKIKKWTKKHNIVIEYEIDGKFFKYLPDFYIEYVDGRIIIEEVKGYIENVEIFLSKMKALKNYCEKKSIEFSVNFFKNSNKYDFLIKLIDDENSET